MDEDLLTEFLYGYSLEWMDEEAGDSVNGPGHWCLIRSPLWDDQDGMKIVLDAATAQEATAEILRRYRIPSDRSQDLK